MDKMSEDSVSDIETLLDDYVVKKLDVSSELKKIVENSEAFEKDLIIKIKNLSSAIINIDDSLTDIKTSIEDASYDFEKDINVLKGLIENKIKQNEDSVKSLEMSIKEKFDSLENEVLSIVKENKFIKILTIIFASINILSLVIIVFGFIKLLNL